MRCAPTASAALVLCAATAGLLSAQGRAAPAEPPEPPRFASWDEVNVLAHGLLQLGHGLREHVERTQGRLGALERRLRACGAACKESGASAAPPRAPESVGPSGEAAPETLGSLQVRGLPLPSCGSRTVWAGGGRIRDSLGSPAPVSREGELEGQTSDDEWRGWPQKAGSSPRCCAHAPPDSAQDPERQD